jgi:hypothetical protein
MKKEQTKKINADFSATTSTDDQITHSGIEAKLKKQYGEITKIQFNVKGKTLTAYLRQPSLAELDATISTLSTAPISSSVGMFRTCFIGGDDELLDMASQTGIAIAINREIQKVIPLVLTTSTTI